MARFYFTFGSDEAFPYQGGWVEVEADTLAAAQAKFKRQFPNRPGHGCLNCSDFYTQAQFDYSGMGQTGNRHAFCHKVIL